MDADSRTRSPARAPGPGLTVDSDAVLGALAVHVRRIFVAHYRYAKGGASSWGSRPMARWDGGEDARGRVHQPVWPRIARLLAAHQIDPNRFIEAQFLARKGGDDVPQPNMLLAASAMAAYHARPPESARLLVLAWHAQMQHLEVEAGARESLYRETPEVAAFYILASPLSELSGLFRYCVACQAGNAALKAMFADAALHQYVFRRHAYDRAWPDQVPPELVRLADAFLSQVSRED
jgi:hypothetical protein